MNEVAAAAARLLGAELRRSEPLTGGDLSTVLRLTLADGRRVIAKAGGRPHSEAAMLRAIAASGAPTPDLLTETPDLLILSEVCNDGRLAQAWDDLAEVLNLLHVAAGITYGWRDDYAFGSVDIANGAADDWPGFWADRRLRCHLDHVAPELAHRIERLATSLAERLPRTPPAALLHGDLWGGNVLTAHGRVTALIDPACYQGHREVDAAMLTLFDHPPRRFFDALVLDPGWRERQPIYRLWPLLVHLRLFGSAYSGAVDETLTRLGA